MEPPAVYTVKPTKRTNRVVTEYEFCLTGRVKPYVRMTRNGKWVRPEAQEYLSSKASLALQLRRQMQDRAMLPREPLCIELTFSIVGKFHNHDLDNLVKAVLDAATGIVYEDDRWVDDVSAHRVKGDSDTVSMYVSII